MMHMQPNVEKVIPPLKTPLDKPTTMQQSPKSPPSIHKATATLLASTALLIGAQMNLEVHIRKCSIDRRT